MHRYRRTRDAGWRSAVRNQDGATAVVFGLMFLVLCASAGLALDFGRAHSSRTHLQDAIDAAVLAGAAAEHGKGNPAAENVLKANLGNEEIRAKATWKLNDDGSFTGTASGSVPTTFMKVLGVESVKVEVTATAMKPKSASTVTLKLTFAKGWDWKQVTLWTHRSGAPDTLIATFTYQPTTLFFGGSGTVSGPLGQALSLGTDYDYAYLKMDVSTDGCGSGFVARHPEAIQESNSAYWDPYECIAGNKGPYVKTYSFRTDDPATANHLFIDGVQLNAATLLAIDQVLPCGKTYRHKWEDTKETDMSESTTRDAWETQDIEFEVTTNACDASAQASSSAWLVR